MSDKNTSQPKYPNGKFPTFRKLVSPKFLKGVGIAFLGLITLVALFYAIENWRGAREWKQVRAMLVEKGEPLSFEDLLPAMPPDEENVAMSPYFYGAFDKTVDPATGEARWTTWQKERAEKNTPKLGVLGLKLVGDWMLGEAVEARWWEWELDLVAEEVNAPLNTNEPFGVLGQLVDVAKTNMDELEEVLERAHSQFPIHYEDNVSALLPHLSEIKRLARLFSFRALVNLDSGNAEAALQDLKTTIRLGETLATEPVLISQIVRQAVAGLAAQGVWEGLAKRSWSGEQIIQLQEELKTIDLLSGYQDSLRGERLLGTELCDLLERDRNYSDYGDWTAGMPERLLGAKFIDRAPRGWYLHNKAFIARMHTEVSIKSVAPTQRRVFFDRVLEYEDLVFEPLKSDRKLFIAEMVMPAVGKALVRAAHAQTSVNLAITACALERYRLANGEFPDDLNALVPDYLTELRHDVVDGAPLRYRKTEQAFVLHSIGADEIDGGGVPGFREKGEKKSWDRNSGDWAWGYSPEDLGLN